MRLFDRLKSFFSRHKKEVDLKARDTYGRYTTVDNAYTVSWNEEFERQVIKEFIEDPKREKQLRELESSYSTNKFREFLQEQERKRKRELK